MKIKELKLKGAAELDIKKKVDGRGWFTRLFCQEKLFSINKKRNILQINSSYSTKKGTIRGMHYQKKPYQEDKVVFCITGEIFDVIVDIRPNSITFGEWSSRVLSSKKMNAIYVPKGFAHGYQTLTDKCQILYFHTEVYKQKSEGGFSFKSPYLSIPWPLNPKNISKKDLRLDNFSEKKYDL